MKDDKKMEKIILEAMVDFYKNSEPKADLGKLMKTGEPLKPEWFMKYYLPQKDMDRIIKETAKKHKLDKFDRHRLEVNCYLGGSPSGVKR